MWVSRDCFEPKPSVGCELMRQMGLAPYIDCAMRGGDDDDANKPNAEPVLKLMEHFDVEAQNVLSRATRRLTWNGEGRRMQDLRGYLWESRRNAVGGSGCDSTGG